VSFIVVFLYAVCALFVCNVCYLSVVLLYYCHRADAQLQLNIYIYIYIYIYISEAFSHCTHVTCAADIASLQEVTHSKDVSNDAL
jgi:hypothetical protein